MTTKNPNGFVHGRKSHRTAYWTGVLYASLLSYLDTISLSMCEIECMNQRVTKRNNLGNPEKHIKRQATRHDCLHSLRSDRDKWTEKVYCEKNLFLLGRLQQPRQNKNLLYRQDKSNVSTKEGSHSYLLFETPFASVHQSTCIGATPD
jgi:hypothetical protein